jgi:hypothetical protein
MDNNQLFGAQQTIVKRSVSFCVFLYNTFFATNFFLRLFVLLIIVEQDDHLDILAESIQRTKHM